MKVKELIEQLQKMPPEYKVSRTCFCGGDDIGTLVTDMENEAVVINCEDCEKELKNDTGRY